MTKQQDLSHGVRPRTVSSPIPYGSPNTSRPISPGNIFSSVLVQITYNLDLEILDFYVNNEMNSMCFCFTNFLNSCTVKAVLTTCLKRL